MRNCGEEKKNSRPLGGVDRLFWLAGDREAQDAPVEVGREREVCDREGGEGAAQRSYPSHLSVDPCQSPIDGFSQVTT
jgi:hypothetical protein